MQRNRRWINLTLCGFAFFTIFSASLSGGQPTTNVRQAVEAPPLFPPPLTPEPFPTKVSMTWMSVTNWFLELNGIKIVTDGFITRIPSGNNGAPLPPDVDAVQRVLDAIGGEVDLIVTGHSHFDHSFDTATWAQLSGAVIAGSRSTCLQAIAQGVDPLQCTIVEGGEVFDLGNGVTMRVVRWNHSGDTLTLGGLRLQAPVELVNAPVPDFINGGLRPGSLRDFPNGGGARAYLFSVDHPERPLHVFYANTGNADTFQQPHLLEPRFFFGDFNFALNNLEVVTETISAQAYLEAAMADAGIDSVDVWLGIGFGTVSGVSTELARLMVPVLQPRAYIPHHWDDFRAPSFFDGLTRIWTNVGLSQFLASVGVPIFIQGQYMDKYIVDPIGVTFDPNSDIKAALGLLDVAFPATATATASEMNTIEHDCTLHEGWGTKIDFLPSFNTRPTD